MPSIITSLHYGYQPNLDALWGAREIVSNAIDGEARHRHLGVGAMSITYKTRSQTVIVRNERVTVPTTALLMGTSDSREDSECIGQFGEGLPVGMLAMERDALIHVTIFNGDEKWEPSIERVAKYGNEPVLVIKTRKLRVHREGFEVHIKGLGPEQYEDLRSMFLCFDDSFDADQAIKATSYSEEKVLLQARYHGKVYNKGVFVMQRDDLMFGYNLDTTLNRDRQMMNEYDLQNRLGGLLRDSSRNNAERFAPLVVDAMFEGDETLETRDEYSTLFHEDHIKDLVVQRFIETHGENAIAVEYEKEVKEAEALGLKGVLASKLINRMVRSRLGTVSELVTQRENAVLRTFGKNLLTNLEVANFETAILLAKSGCPAAKDVTFQVVSFGSPEIRHIVDPGSNTVRLSRSHLLDLGDTLQAAVRGVCTLTLSVERETLANIVVHLLRGGGTAGLALELLALEG